MKRTASKKEVEDFIQAVKDLISDSEDNVVIQKRYKNKDKTSEFMVKYGVDAHIICEELLNLDVSNYSYTNDDYDCRFDGEVWVFGKMMETFFPEMIEVYIKLKISNKVICISFHQKEFDLFYPYL